MKIGLGARILLNARGKVAAALGPRAGAAGIVHAVRVSRSPLAVLIALAALAFLLRRRWTLKPTPLRSNEKTLRRYQTNGSG